MREVLAWLSWHADMLGVVKLKLVTFLLPEAYLEGLDKLVGMGRYPSRSAVIRLAVRDLLRRELRDQKGRLQKKSSPKKRRRGKRRSKLR